MKYRLDTQYSTFDYASITAESINVLDIASSLSKICRFNGHTKKFYSVAQHSIFVHYLSKVLSPPSLDVSKYALVHDFHEAYISDINTIFKNYIMDAHGFDFKIISDDVDDAIYEAFGMQLPNNFQTAEVKFLDKLALLIELAFVCGYTLNAENYKTTKTYINDNIIAELFRIMDLSMDDAEMELLTVLSTY